MVLVTDPGVEPALDPRAHFAAVRALVEAQYGTWEVYGWVEAPGDENNPDEQLRKATPDVQYAMLLIERLDYDADPRARTTTVTSWLVSVTYVGSTHAGAQWMQWRTDLALNNVWLTVAERRGRVGFYSSDGPQAESGRYRGVSRFTYTL